MFSGFLKKKKAASTPYDPALKRPVIRCSICTGLKRPVIRCSICTGEQVAGFQRLDDGGFEEVMLIRNEADLRLFREQYKIVGSIEKIY